MKKKINSCVKFLVNCDIAANLDRFQSISQKWLDNNQIICKRYSLKITKVSVPASRISGEKLEQFYDDISNINRWQENRFLHFDGWLQCKSWDTERQKKSRVEKKKLELGRKMRYKTLASHKNTKMAIMNRLSKWNVMDLGISIKPTYKVSHFFVIYSYFCA